MTSAGAARARQMCNLAHLTEGPASAGLSVAATFCGCMSVRIRYYSIAGLATFSAWRYARSRGCSSWLRYQNPTHVRHRRGRYNRECALDGHSRGSISSAVRRRHHRLLLNAGALDVCDAPTSARVVEAGVFNGEPRCCEAEPAVR